MSNTKFSIQFVGTGNAWSKPPINFNTNAIVSANGKKWLIDCGLLCPLALNTIGISQKDIDAIFITHLHGDHVLGLEELLFTRFFAHARKHCLWIPDAFLGKNAEDNGTHIWNNCLRAAMETYILNEHTPLVLSSYADIHELSPGHPFEILGLNCELFPVEHAFGKPAFGIIIENRVAFTSDTRFSAARIDMLLNRGIETIFHETTFHPPFPGNIHTSFDELAALPRDIASHIVLMHYADSTAQDDFKRAESLGFRIAHKAETFSF